MTKTDVTDLTDDALAALLAVWAEGSLAVEAGVELLVAHHRWLGRPDFRQQLVDYVHEGCSSAGVGPMAVIDWDWVDIFAHDAPCSGSERSILLLASSLAGAITGQSLLAMTSSLDGANSTRVLAALSHRFGWHQGGLSPEAAGGPCVFPAAAPPRIEMRI
jgi:hypothetical protein